MRRVRRRQDVAFVAVRGSRCAAPGWRGSIFAMTNRLPPWTSEGILPPFLGSPAAPSRSPYDVSLRELVERFGTTVERRTILRGLLQYRAALHRLGYSRGFQWVNGSFTENVERIEARAPRDVDVVTFVHDPSCSSGLDGDAAALDHTTAKAAYKVDSYIVELDQLPAPDLVRQSSYWYSLWSHRRSLVWKGFLQVSLTPDEDAADALLRELDARGTS